MKLSIVDISTVMPGESRRDALRHSIELAQHAERLGYERIWFAEHHGAKYIAGRAPEIMIAAVAAQTKTIRVGSGSVLLNHYSAFKVAEVFSTLNELYPDRIDLGAGRATTGPVSDFALQQDRAKRFHSNSDQQIVELVSWLDSSFPADHPFLEIPIYNPEGGPRLHLLGSSAWSGAAAAQLGLRYVFAGFINQAQAHNIVSSYRRNFQAAAGQTGIQHPELILSLHVVCADSEEEVQKQLAPVHIMYRNLSKGVIDKPLLSPDEAVKEYGGLPELPKYITGSNTPPRFVGGTIDSVRQQLEDIAKDFAVEEIMIQDMITDHTARLRSYELLSTIITK